MSRIRSFGAVSLAALIAAAGAVGDAASAATITATTSVVTPPVTGSASLYSAGQISTVTYDSAGTYSYGGWSPLTGATGGPNAFVDPTTNPSWVSIGGSSGYGSLAFTFKAPTATLSLLWGSPSNSNVIALYSGGTNVNGVITGGTEVETIQAFEGYNNTPNTTLVATDLLTNTTSVIASNLLNSTNPSGYQISISGETFNQAVFSNNGGGFEISKVSAVPLPAALPLFGGALLGFAGLARRRRRARSDTAAS